jgi:hypothetical protein
MTTATIPTTLFSQPYNFSNVSERSKRTYRKFTELTEGNGIDAYGRGANLQKLAKLAFSMRNVIHICRLDISLNHQVQEQWQLNRLSEVKEKLSKAIAMKRSYYDGHLLGVITKYFLMLVWKWNSGDTEAIIAAEDFLLAWDSRKPVMKISNRENSHYGLYYTRQDFRTSDLDTSHYYNYNPRRLIELDTDEKIDYSRL